MGQKVRYILLWTVPVVLLVLCGLWLRASRMAGAMQTCDNIRVEMLDSYRFITEDDVKGWITSLYGPCTGQKADSVDLCRIEKIVDRQSAVLKSEAYMDAEGVLNVSITQREPVARFQNGSDGFYVDNRGCIFPLQSHYTSNVPVIDGHLPFSVHENYKGEVTDERGRRWMAQMLELTAFLTASPVWSENIVQIHVESNGDLTLVPREGRERFIFGPPVRIAGKFSLMDRYYRSVKPEVEDNLYKTVNVKYEGQIICRK